MRIRLQILLLAAACGLLLLYTVSHLQPDSCRVERDLSFRGMTMEEMKALEEQEKDGMTGLTSLAGWRNSAAEAVSDLEGRKQEQAGIIHIYGPMSLAFPSRILSGSLDQFMGKKDCVLTKELAWSLFGSVAAEGLTVSYGGRDYRVAAVIDRSGKLLFLSAETGAVQTAAFSFDSRERLSEKMEILGFPEEQPLP